MTDVQKRDLLIDRLTKLQNSPKNIKCPGVVRKCKRQLKALTTKLTANNAD